MTVQFFPNRIPPRQFAVTTDDGRTLEFISQTTAEAILRKSGLSVRQASAEIAAARLATVVSQ